jgi:hypothetical protein
MTPEKRKAYELNAPGDFYVEDGMCITCGAPEAAAPDLVVFYVDSDGSDRNTHCYFRRQPTSPAELEQAIQAVHVSCCAAVRYRGSNSAVLRRLTALGDSPSCDALAARPATSLARRLWQRLTSRLSGPA